MNFLEGQKVLVLRDDLSQAEQISYVQQMASFYTELDRTSFEAIGSLGLGGVVGPLDLLDTVTGPNGRPIGTRLGPYESLRASRCGCLYYADDWSQKAPDSDSCCLFSLECMHDRQGWKDHSGRRF
jgi:hypothetical protein